MNFVSSNELRDTQFVCDASEYVLAPPSYSLCSDPASVTTVGLRPDLVPSGANLSQLTSDTIIKCGYACGLDVLNSFGADYSDNDMARNLGIVTCFAAAFGIAAFTVIKYVNHIQR